MAKFDVKRMLIEATLTKLVADLQTKPEDALDRYIKQAQSGRRSREQAEILDRVTQMLSAKDSLYRKLLCNSLRAVEAERLRALALLGYDIANAAEERLQGAELRYGVHIPALLCLDLGGSMTMEKVQKLVAEEELLGVCSYAIFCQSERDIAALPTLFSAHPDCIFLLTLRPEAVSPYMVEAWRSHRNVIPFVQTRHGEGRAALRLLMKAGFLCGSAFFCQAEDFALLEAGRYRSDATATQAPFALVLPNRLTKQQSARLHTCVSEQREAQAESVIPLDLWQDGMALDMLLTKEAALLYIDATGESHYYEGDTEKNGGNLCDKTFIQILEAL